MKTATWKFKAEAFETRGAFYLQPEVPFIGNYRQAKIEGQKRAEIWENINGDFVCVVTPEAQVRKYQKPRERLYIPTPEVTPYG